MGEIFDLTLKPSQAVATIAAEDVKSTADTGFRVLSSAWRLLSGERPDEVKDDITLRDFLMSRKSKDLSDSRHLFELNSKLNREHSWIFESPKTFCWLLRFVGELRKAHPETVTKEHTHILKFLMKKRKHFPELFGAVNKKGFMPFI